MLLTEETAARVKKWHEGNGGHARCGPGPHALRTMNEFVEFCLAAGCTPRQILNRVNTELHRQQNKGNVGGQFNPNEYIEEFADVRLCVEIMRAHGNINEDVACNAKLLILGTRDFEADPYGVLWRPGRSMGY